MQNPYNPPNASQSPELPSDTRHLVHIGPVGAATTATGALLMMALVLFAVLRFFQAFDPTPPPLDQDFNVLLVGGLIALLATCFIATALTCWCFNFAAPRLGGIRYKVR